MKDQVGLGRVELKVFWVGLFRDTLSVQLDALGWGGSLCGDEGLGPGVRRSFVFTVTFSCVTLSKLLCLYIVSFPFL